MVLQINTKELSKNPSKSHKDFNQVGLLPKIDAHHAGLSRPYFHKLLHTDCPSLTGQFY
jgi:hypothetical protein